MQIVKYKDFKNNKTLQDAFLREIDFEKLDSVDKIIDNVRKNGNKALLELSKQFKDGDFKTPDDFIVNEKEIQKALNSTDKNLLDSIKTAIKNVEEFSKAQFGCIKELEFQKENSILGHKIVPMERVLCYCPGGNYPLLSSAYMTIIPAKVAGVKEIYLTSPKISKEVIAAAFLAGATKIYKLGGAQAIAAFAYGTETIKSVDKITGPGNKFVAAAKKSVFGKCDIDFIAGPSEVLIVADKNANPKLIAADMLAQAEHDKDARSYLITTSETIAKKVEIEANYFLETLKTKEIAQISFEKSMAIVVDKIEDAIELTNIRAPEHLELMFEDIEKYIDEFKNYGSIFIGENCAEVFGDYCSGTNHVLPTNRAAKYTGGLSVFDYIKIQTYQKLSKNYSKQLSKTASLLSEAEGLYAHKLASDLRNRKD